MTMNPDLKDFSCVRCKALFPPGDYVMGCPECGRTGFPASLAAVYQARTPLEDRLPYVPKPSGLVGDTPVLALDQSELGVAWLGMKMEGANPTGSHKDRLSPLVIARARQLGRTRVIAASSGNAGVSLAKFAADAGLACTIVVKTGMAGTWIAAMRELGAEVVTAPSTLARWSLMQRLVEERGDYPTTNVLNPPVGSNPIGVQGYKTVAYEIVRSDPRCFPQAVIVPTCRGDLLWGIWSGFTEARDLGLIDQVPRMVAVEPFPRLERVMRGEDYRQLFAGDTSQVSIGGGTVTFQAWMALKASAGTAVVVGDRAAHAARARLATIGIKVESCSAATHVAARQLREAGSLQANDRVMLIATGNGQHEPVFKKDKNLIKSESEPQ